MLYVPHLAPSPSCFHSGMFGPALVLYSDKGCHNTCMARTEDTDRNDEGLGCVGLLKAKRVVV